MAALPEWLAGASNKMKRNSIYASTAGITCHYHTLLDMLVALTDAGIEQIELGWAPPPGSLILPKDLAKFQARWLVHNYFPTPPEPFVLNLASQHPATLKRSREFCLQAIELSAGIGAPFYSVHCGFLGEFEPAALGRQLKHTDVCDYERGYATFISSLQLLLNGAKSAGIRLLIEPNVVVPFNLVDGRNRLLMLAEPQEFSRLLADLPDERLGVLLDLGHLKVTAATLGFGISDFIDVVALAVGAFHLHDNDGTRDQHQPVRADSWALDVCRDPRFAGRPVVNEAKFAGVQEMVGHCRWLEKILNP